MARSSQHVAGDLLPGGNSNLLSGGRSGARVAVPVRRHCLRIKVHLQGTRATLNQLPTGRTGTDPTHCGTTVAHPPHAVIQRPHWGGGGADWAGGHAGGWGPWGSNSWRASAVPHRENIMGPLRARRKACTAGRSDTMSSVTPWTQRGVDIWFSPQQPLVYPVAKRRSLTREPHGHARLHGNP